MRIQKISVAVNMDWKNNAAHLTCTMFTIELIQQDTVQYNTVEYSRKGKEEEMFSKRNSKCFHYSTDSIQQDTVQYNTVGRERKG